MSEETAIFNEPEFEKDIEAMIEGDLVEEKFDALQEALKRDPELLKTYLAAVRTDQLLRKKYEEAEESKVVAFPGSRGRKALWGVGMGIAAVVVISLVMLNRLTGPVSSAEPELAAEIMPEFQFAPGAVFESTRHDETSLDGKIHEGELVAMREGYVSVTLNSGTEAVIQSPSSFSITGENSLKLDHGEAWFRVPEGAEGFTVELPWMDVIDLGTVFTVLADEAVNQVHVEEGAVEARDRENGESHQLAEGQILERFRDGSVSIQTAEEYLKPEKLSAGEVVFYENLVYVPDQEFSRRVPLTGTWEVASGEPRISEGRYVSGDSGDDEEILTFGRFTEAMEKNSEATLMVSFRAKAPEHFFHSKGFAGVSLFDGDREVVFFGDMSNNSYSWGVVDYGKKYNPESRGQPTYDLPIQGSEESFTLRYRAKTGELDIFRGWGVKGVPVLKVQSDPGLGFDRIRVAGGKGGDFAFDVMKVSIIR